MLKKIETKEIMTHWQARNVYRDYYFHFLITEEVDRGDNDLGYVIYIYDNLDEMQYIPREELRHSRVSITLGVAAEPPGLIGGIEFRGKI